MVSALGEKLCLITLSNNADHQNTTFGMFNELYDRYAVYCISGESPKAGNAPHTDSNAYVRCPKRPGITLDTFNLICLLRIVKQLRQFGCTGVYFESVHLWNAPIMLALGKRVRRIQTIHDVVPHDGSRAVYLCQRLLCSLADEVVLKSDTFLDRAIADYGLPRDKVSIFPVWRDYPEYSEPTKSGRMLFFGRMKRYKGLDNIAAIVGSCPNISFDVVGAPDEEAREVVEAIKRLPNANVVDREVSDEEMAEYFRQADWVVLPYESASQSGVIIDAYKYSRPVVAFNVGAIGEQVSNGSTGFLVKSNDLEGFIDTVRKASDVAGEALCCMSRQAYDFGCKCYSTRSLANQFAKAFGLARLAG